MSTILNPLTQRQINIGSAVYWRLVKKGIIQDQSGLQPPQYLAPTTKQQIQVPIPVPKAQISRAYTGLRGQLPINQQVQYTAQPMQMQKKPKMPPQQKINNIIKSATMAYKKTLENVNHQDFEMESEDELTQYIQQELINNLKSSGNKHINKYL